MSHQSQNTQGESLSRKLNASKYNLIQNLESQLSKKKIMIKNGSDLQISLYVINLYNLVFVI